MRFALIEDGRVIRVVDFAEPPTLPSNWVATEVAGPGWTYNGSAFAPAVIVDPCEWLIDVGDFFDRFGAAKMPLLSSESATVQAFVKDLLARPWVDLQDPEVAAGLDALILLQIAGVDAELKASILTDPVLPDENSALRKVYFT
jgi:hypothetical protein